MKLHQSRETSSFGLNRRSVGLGLLDEKRQVSASLSLLKSRSRVVLTKFGCLLRKAIWFIRVTTVWPCPGGGKESKSQRVVYDLRLCSRSLSLASQSLGAPCLDTKARTPGRRTTHLSNWVLEVGPCYGSINFRLQQPLAVTK